MIQPLAYIAAENAPFYRAIMRVFMESRERFVFHLRPQEIVDSIRTAGLLEAALAEVEPALARLCEWGNLQTRPDSRVAGSVEEFFNPRHAFQLTAAGQAAERALEFFDTTSRDDSGLQCTAVSDLRVAIQELRQLSREVEPDAGHVRRGLLMLRAGFEDLTAAAETFLARLEQPDQAAHDIRSLVDYGEKFIGELVLAADGIVENIRDIDAAGFERLLQSAAGRGGDADAWRSRWAGIRRWFVSEPGRHANAEVLRERARASMPALLSVVASINDQRIRRIDRSNDFRVLARWFAEADSDAEAHRLWRAAFGLSPARHLIINDETLDDHEAFDVRPNTSWLDAPPLRIAMRLRDYTAELPAVSMSRIIDRTAEKEKLAAATHEEALRILNAQRRFGTGRRMRLSELEQLDVGEFDLFLDLLGEAISARVLSTEPVEIMSGDGSLKVRLEPTGDGRDASIATSDGVFSGPDHWISIEQIADEVLL